MSDNVPVWDESEALKIPNPFTGSINRFYQTPFHELFPGLLDGGPMPCAVCAPEVRYQGYEGSLDAAQVGRFDGRNLFARVNPNDYLNRVSPDKPMAFDLALLNACAPGEQPAVPKPAFNKVYRATKMVCEKQPLIDAGGGNGFKLAFAFRKPGIPDNQDRYGGPFVIVVDSMDRPLGILPEGEAQEGIVYRQCDINEEGLSVPEGFLVISVNSLTNFSPQLVASLENVDSYSLVSDLEYLKSLNITTPMADGRVKTRLKTGDHVEYDHRFDLEYMPFLTKGSGYGLHITVAARELKVSGPSRFLAGPRVFPWYSPESVRRYSQESHKSFPSPYKLKMDGTPGAINITSETVEVQIGGAGFYYNTDEDHLCTVPVMLEGEVIYPPDPDDKALFYPHRMFLGGRPCGYKTISKFLQDNESALDFIPDLTIKKMILFDNLNEAYKADHASPLSDGVISLANNCQTAAKVVETVDITASDLEPTSGLMKTIGEYVSPRRVVVSNMPGYKRNRYLVSECHLMIRPLEIEIMAFRGRRDKVQGNRVPRILSMMPNCDVTVKANRLQQIKNLLALDVSVLFEIPRELGVDKVVVQL